MYNFKLRGFTLAEVLITLGIIGIVAAMTIPGLVTNYKVKVLESKFKKADSVLQQALLTTANEIGYDTLTGLVSSSTDSEFNDILLDLNKSWENQFDGITRISNGISYLFGRGVTFNNMFGKPLSGHVSNYFPAYNDDRAFITKDGMMFTYFAIASGHGLSYFTLKFDTNGPYVGPNRLGYDIFTYNTYEYSYNSYCDPTLIHSENQKGCYHYAHRGINPSGRSSSYWDILYKPINYWQKNK